MANGFGNKRHDGLNYAQPQNNTGQTACRLCYRIFTNTQALITHIESHMEHEEVAIRRLYSQEHTNNNSQRQLAPQSHRFPPNFSLPRRNPIFSASSQVCSSQEVRQMLFPPHVFSSAGNNINGGGLLAQLPPPQVHLWKPEEEYSNDGTKAYILQLEKPIKKIDFIDLDNNDDDNSDVQTLDLALKL